MSDELPYKAEYAKSGRSGCKGCKSNIAQNSLRIAKMIQSPHFDGKVPNWYHYSCFLNKFKAKNCEEIGCFDKLRWEDQEKIREKIEGGGTVKNEVDSSSSKEKEFVVEYAKSGRAACRHCKEKIKKNEIRIAKMVQHEEERFSALVPYWYHVKCFSACACDLNADKLVKTDVNGFTTLSGEDQELVMNDVKWLNDPGDEKKSVKKIQKDKKPMKTSGDKIKKKLKEQSKIYWKLRDNLAQHCTNSTIRQMLDENRCNNTGGESDILDRCADGILFGALVLCPECKEGRLEYKSEGYLCTGNISGWTKCMYVTKSPQRIPWKIAADLKADNQFLSGLKLIVQERVFPESMTPKTELKKESSNDPPLHDKKIVVAGKLKESKVKTKAKIEELGGSLIENVTGDCYCCLSLPGEVLKSSKKMQKVELYNIPVVTEDYLEAIKKGGADLLLTQYAIAPWGGKNTEEEKTHKRKASVSIGDEKSKKSKMTLKSGAVVDPESGMDDTHHILSHESQLYSMVLGLVDLSRGTNSYYKFQILEHDQKLKSSYLVFRSWGRVGTSIGGNKIENFSSKEDAIANFQYLYEDKTGNSWHNRGNFVKLPYKFYPLDIDYGQDDALLQSSVQSGSLSLLTSPVQSLIKLIFDVEAMKHTLVEFEIDLKKMPLGKLSKKQIEMAYACLGECQKSLAEDAPKSKIMDASNRFFTLIPHDFGMKKPPLLDNSDIITMKVAMLDSLLEIEVAYSLLKGANDGGEKDPIDAHYESLNTEIKDLRADCEDFKMIAEYVKNTHAKTHSNYSLKVEEVFSVERKGEKQRYSPFKDLHNKKLLWHGSRTTNFVGILSQGLRIAPPEAPVTGYMFGKGIYFADMASKSANYCQAKPGNNTGLMLLCEVALGNMYELTHAKHITKLPAGKHSCKGLGKTSPDPKMDRTLPDGVTVPLGKGKGCALKGSSLLYNEYIVYDVSQVNMRYLVKLNFDYKY